MTNYEPSAQAPDLGKARKIPTLIAATAAPSLPGHDPQAATGLELLSRRYIASFIGGRHDGGFVSAAEAAALPQNDVDIYADLIRRIWIIRKSDGNALIHRKRVKRAGKNRQAFMLKMMRYAPAVLPPSQWGLMDPQIDSHYHKATVTPTVSCLRRFLLGEPGSEYYIVTADPLAYGWNVERSFRVIALTTDWWRILDTE